ncbi:MAG: nuclear transport factor 2 family protein, partial [Mycobacteriaceae bacterium]
LHGNAQIAAGVLAAVAHLRATRHNLGQQVIDASDGDTASAETSCTAHHLYAHGGDVRDNALAIRYRDAFRRDEGGWRIARRELQIDFADDRPVTQPG